MCDLLFLPLTLGPPRSATSRPQFSNSTTPYWCRPAPRSAASPTQTGPGFASRPCAIMPRPWTLSRLLKQAEPVYAETPDATFDLLRPDMRTHWHRARPRLLEYSTQLPGSRVLEDRYGANLNRMVVPKGKAGRLAYVSEFVEEAKASGLVQKAIDRGGPRGSRWPRREIPPLSSGCGKKKQGPSRATALGYGGWLSLLTRKD